MSGCIIILLEKTRVSPTIGKILCTWSCRDASREQGHTDEELMADRWSILALDVHPFLAHCY